MDKQRDEWNLIAAGWRKWDEFLMQWLKPFGDEIIELARIGEGDMVLDVATGSGEPGLSAAKRVGRGRVVGIDVSEEMVRIARAKAEKEGIRNYDAHIYSSSALPFDTNSFDAVISRFGIMFFPDVFQGLTEMARVLKPGGRMCVAVWGPQDKKAKSVSQTLVETLRLPKPSPDDPSAYRCSEPGMISLLMSQAGLHKVKETEVKARRTFTSFDKYWEYLLDTNPKMSEGFRRTNEEMATEIKHAVRDRVHPNRKGEVFFDSIARISSGFK